MKLGLEIIYVKTNRWRQEISKQEKKNGKQIQTD